MSATTMPPQTATTLPAVYVVAGRFFETEAEVIDGRDAAMIRTPSGHMRMFSLATNAVYHSKAKAFLRA